MFNFFIENTNNIPVLIHGIGLGLISIFLTAIIFIYTASQREMQDWDRIILLEKVVNVKDFFIYLSLIFIPPFLWGISNPINISIIIIASLGLIYLFYQLNNIYKWIRDIEPIGSYTNIGYRQNLREEFLNEEKDISEKTKIWSLTWSQENINSFTERRLTKIFFEQSKKRAEMSDWENLRDWLHYFNSNRENREFRDWINIEIAIKNILKINEIKYKESKKGDIKSNHIYCTNIISDLLNFFISQSLSNSSSFILFKTLKEHIQNKDKKYQEYLIQKIYRNLFETIPKAKENYDIWNHYLPNEWKVTENHLKDNHISFLLFKYFIEWAKDRISSKKDKDWDKKLEEVSRNLFPELSPSWWSEILTYLIRPYGENRAKDLLKFSPNFGYIGHMFSGFITEEGESFNKEATDRITNEQENTISFTVKHLISKLISKKQIEEFIEDLKKIEVKEEREKFRKKKLQTIFDEIVSKMNKIS